MGTCVGLRNIRYFVCFLTYTALHGFLTFLISLAYFAVVSSGSLDQLFGGNNKNKPEDPNDPAAGDQQDGNEDNEEEMS